MTVTEGGEVSRSVPVSANAQRVQAQEQSLYLGASAFSTQCPRAEMLAIVREYPIVVFTKPGSRTCDDFVRGEATGLGENEDTAALREFLE